MRDAAINGLKQQWEEGLKARQAELETAKKRLGALASGWDPALPPPLPARGALHPLNRLMDRLVEVFRPLGFHVEEGPEVETEAHNFDGLNIPGDHPAKASSDTFYLAAHPELLLRTHTSPVQVRTLLRVAPDLEKRGGIRFLAPGRVYRKDEIDPTHSPMFHQVEGMLVGRGIGMQHLKGTLEYALRALFGPDTEIRLRVVETLVKRKNISTLRITFARIIPIIAPPPTLSNTWPINQGRIMPPVPAPRRNQPATVPVTCMRSSARFMKVGKIEACEIPNRMVPAHRMVSDCRKTRMSPRLTRQPAKLIDSIVIGFARVETQTPNKRARAKDPQNAEVK